MVFKPDGDMSSGTECDLIQLEMRNYLDGGHDQEVNEYVHVHLNGCDKCHKHLFEVAFPEE